jgi:hypothetical protein
MTVDSRFDIRLLVLWTQTSHLVIELKMIQKCNITHANIENHRILIDTKNKSDVILYKAKMVPLKHFRLHDQITSGF